MAEDFPPPPIHQLRPKNPPSGLVRLGMNLFWLRPLRRTTMLANGKAMRNTLSLPGSGVPRRRARYRGSVTRLLLKYRRYFTDLTH